MAILMASVREIETVSLTGPAKAFSMEILTEFLMDSSMATLMVS